jgi:ribonuclease Z
MAGRDVAATLPDGLHVFMCGTGSPMPDPSRAGPCIGVLVGTRPFLFDVGSGSVRKLGRMGFQVANLERVYLTHLHSDHFDGLGELLVQAWVTGGRTSPLPISGPTGVDEVVAGFNMAYRIDSGFRHAHHGPDVAAQSGAGGAAEPIVWKDANVQHQILHKEGDVTITAVRVSHPPVDPAFGYRIDYKDRAIVISGDTIYSENLVLAATGADMLLHEALNPKMVAQLGEALGARGQTRAAKIMADIPIYHATPEDAARVASKAGVAHLTYYHTIPPMPSSAMDKAFLGDAGKIFKGRITVSRDGMLFSLPAGDTRIIQDTVMR